MLRRLVSPSVRRLFSSTADGVMSDFPGAAAPYTGEIQFVKGRDPMPVFRVLDRDGTLLSPKHDPKWSKERCLDVYRQMVFINEMDDILYKAQRHGQISFYMTNYGEEAAQIGSAAALESTDEIYAQYREVGVLLHRGFPVDRLMAQCFSTVHDYGKGRQMPVHYGSRELRFQTISSPLATQIPQAAGAAYALKREGRKNVLFTDCFNCMPVAALVDDKILCMHGGLSPELHSLEQIRRVMRPTDVPDSGLLCDLLWSDPDENVTNWDENDRGVSFVFGPDVVEKFLEKHDLDLVCRAHQVVEDGYQFFGQRRLVTIFSAPNYCNEFDNAGAMMSVDETLMCSFQILKPAEKKQ